ncbi:unnamed protein product [Plutella xylostella]|uniref:Tetraspanin n=1 Tax=Plutella xylostella TaxID=51655 RepID=A0A8S4DCZ7_PLUXY|nr:23 kDa integral membrane protein [Plutella xylostella]CAG9095830.1 unnamed protein product [Plutella xylostella]
MKFNLVQFSRGCSKGLLMALNVICILMALSTFAFAVVDARILKQYGESQATGTFVGDLVIIAASLLLVVVACLGCVGAAREHAKMLYLYVGMLMILVVLELLIGIFVSVQRYGLEFRVTDWIRDDFFRNVTADDEAEHRRLWDDLETTYECCGLNGPEDYRALLQPISTACCPRAHRARSELARQRLYQICIETVGYNSGGCEEEILYALREGGECLLGVAVMAFWFEAGGMLLAMWMANNLKNEVKIYKSTVKY